MNFPPLFLSLFFHTQIVVVTFSLALVAERESKFFIASNFFGGYSTKKVIHQNSIKFALASHAFVNDYLMEH